MSIEHRIERLPVRDEDGCRRGASELDRLSREGWAIIHMSTTPAVPELEWPMLTVVLTRPAAGLTVADGGARDAD